MRNQVLKSLLFLTVFQIAIGCQSKYDGYQELESGLFFKVETISDEEKRIQKNNFLQFKYVFKSPAGDTIDASRILLKVNEVYKSGGLLEALSMINEKERGSAIFPLSKLNDDLEGAFNFDGFDQEMLVHAEFQIDSIFTEQEFTDAKKHFLNWISTTSSKSFDTMQEEAEMDDYESAKGLKTEKSVTGLRYTCIKNGTGEPSGFGKRVKIKYEGKFLNGELFNSTKALDEGVQDFYLGQEMQVIKGIEEALTYMREGDKFVLLIPSWLAFGNKGSSTGVVPGLTPVLYELELISVN